MAPPEQKAPLVPSEALPRAFGRYVLFDEIGRGGMANIFLARLRLSLESERLMVVKRILRELSDDPAFAHMLIAEAKLAAQLTHANVVHVLELGREQGQLFIAMEYVEGFDLNEMLRRLTAAKVPLPAEFALFIVREILAGLDYAHRARNDRGEPLAVVHRDVSPSNVLISFEGEVKLCDFGIARALRAGDGPDASAIQRSRLAGKAAYMAPEHARGEAVDRRADIFAAGVLMWELCAGRRLYRGTETEMLALAKRADVPPLPPRGLPMQPTLQAILDNALAKRPADRWPTAAEFLRGLDNYVLETRLGASQLRFGQFLTEHFSKDIVAVRRAREIAARHVDLAAMPGVNEFDEEPTTLEAPSPMSALPSAVSDVSGIPTITRPAHAPSPQRDTRVAKRSAAEVAALKNGALDVDIDDLMGAVAAADGHQSLAVSPEEMSTTADAPAAIVARRSTGSGRALSAKAPPDDRASASAGEGDVLPDVVGGEVAVPMRSPAEALPAADPLLGLVELPPLTAPAPVLVRHVPLSIALAALFAIGLTVGVGVAAILLAVT